MKAIDVLYNGEDTGKEAFYVTDKGYSIIKVRDFMDILGEHYLRVSDLSNLFGLDVEGLGNQINIIHSIESSNPNGTNNSLAGKNIVIDPGHSAGANVSPVDSSYAEGDYVLEVALALEEMLLERNANVYLTRRTGEDVSLYQRGTMYADINPDLLLSIHTNAMGNTPQTRASGVEIIYSVRQTNARPIAEEMMRVIAEHMNMNTRRVFSRESSSSTPNNPIDWYGILRHSVDHTHHSFIIEGGFHDNPNDLAKLVENNGHLQNAQSILKAIEAYFDIV
ncbi:N-acetylmuramoyl-L-alanine amidase [Natranaerovirga hydrolytica]|uniref:N-acetylmuramoyl-L-alanine amidase n=1 Tax=Natranaerovirga hydrolytica TaxID=680378 RepID=A0A4R1N4W9_9FIRM|nr:N-acetylmuramoyl-L-alanine amidase [Natranaerovirga hydrolytica]TCK97999.1 N-acetylmuramoyl-L-alanine amidase [Natranaerovirga hydrolytica]